jgi:hypothetical protein
MKRIADRRWVATSRDRLALHPTGDSTRGRRARPGGLSLWASGRNADAGLEGMVSVGCGCRIYEGKTARVGRAAVLACPLFRRCSSTARGLFTATKISPTADGFRAASGQRSALLLPCYAGYGRPGVRGRPSGPWRAGIGPCRPGLPPRFSGEHRVHRGAWSMAPLARGAS